MALFKKIVSILIAMEGVFHFLIPAVTLYGMYQANEWGWMILINPISDIFFGFLCLTASYLLGIKHNH